MKTNFTKIFLLCSFLFLIKANAQTPNKFSYQAVIRNASNLLVSNANVGIKISILQTTTTGTVVFSEYHTPTTNNNGLVTLEIGGGTILTGNFATINWANGPYFIKTETDPTGPGTNYTISGTSQMLSVPFALYAATSGSTASSWTTTGTNIANNNTGNVGIGTGVTIPSSLLTVKKTGQGFTQEDNTGTNKIGFYTNGTDAFLQTHSNTDLSFTTNDGLAKMTLQKTTGNLGIGITTPTEKLEVAGKTKTTNLQVTTGAGDGKILTSDATGNATWQTNSSIHTIGENYGGGLVFFVYDGGRHGLIVAPNDAGISPWSAGIVRFTGTTGDGVNAGAMNTTLIVAQQMAGNPTGNFAAKMCADYSVTVAGITYGDWYLPSLSELKLLYDNKVATGGTIATSDRPYWSSTENSENHAYSLHFLINGVAIVVKWTTSVSIRPIRSF
jgi:hypothetical protein